MIKKIFASLSGIALAATMFATPAFAETDAVESGSLSLSAISWSEGLPKVEWSAYTGGTFDGYAVFVREGNGKGGDILHLANAFYLPKDQTSHQMTKMKLETTYSARVVPYVQVGTNKAFILPGSSTLVFKTNHAEEMSCGNSEGNDGLYSACEGDSIIHKGAKVEVRVLHAYGEYVRLQLRGVETRRIVSVKLGESFVAKTKDGVSMTITFTEKSAKYGTFLDIKSFGDQ